jgi:hypothetical protein
VSSDVRLSVASGLTDPDTTSIQITEPTKLHDLFADALVMLDSTSHHGPARRIPGPERRAHHNASCRLVGVRRRVFDKRV